MSYVSGFMIGASIGKSIHQFFSNAGRPGIPQHAVKNASRPAPAVPLFRRASKSPGRRRYYARSLVRNQPLAGLLAQCLYKMSGIRRVEITPRTGSILLLGDEKTLDTVEKVLSEQVFSVPLPGEELMKELDEAKTMEQKVESDFRHTAADVCRMFNQGVSDSTGHLLDLKALVSLMFIIRGLRRIITMNERASGPQLLWWAYSLLRGK